MTDVSPERAAISQAYHLPDQDLATRLLFTTPRRAVGAAAARRPPARAVHPGSLASEGDLSKEQLTERVHEVFADPLKRDFVLALGPTAVPDAHRAAGYRNDLDRFAEITSLELEKITAPTLVVQGTADSDRPPTQSTYAAATIPAPSC